MFNKIIKRDGRSVPYNIEKITVAIDKAMKSCYREDTSSAVRLARIVEAELFTKYGENPPTVEQVQDMVENVLMNNGYAYVAKKYILYRSERTKRREMNSRLMLVFDELTRSDAVDSDMKRENANIDGNTAMGTMLKYGSEGAKDYYEKYLLTDEQARAHKNGDIHIHDFDFYALTTTCCQIDLVKLFKGGFSTGHGYLREPQHIGSYCALACIAIQSNQNDQHGGQSVPNFDYGLAEGVTKTYRNIYRENFAKALELLSGMKFPRAKTIDRLKEIQKNTGLFPQINITPEYIYAEKEAFNDVDPVILEKTREYTLPLALEETDQATYKAMVALVHNLNTMHSRAGAQTPFSSINYGLDTSPEGRMIIKNVLLATEEGLGFGETAIFPIHIFRVKDGVNYNPGEPNYDLFLLAMRVSAKRLFPNFAFVDAPYNLKYYVKGRPETEVAYMGCRTRVIANTYDAEQETVFGRGNLSFTSINLPRIAINSNGSIEWFFEELTRKIDLAARQLLDRYAIQARKKVKNFPFLFGQGVWLGSENLGAEDEIGELLKHGTLSIGFIGLAEALVALTGKHHGESESARTLGYEIISFMRQECDRFSAKYKMNFTLLATPGEGLSGRFVKLDRAKFGEIKGVTDREYYTNSFHVPVYFQISAYEKIKIEAPYHALTNAGHISYVELDGDISQNLEAFEKIVRCMKESGIGYGSINHPVDRDPVCGYNGIINDECPNCHRSENGSALGFERIRRITGYLVGTLDHFNNAKRAEERDRIKHKL